ncbi:extracellular solute-binding protein [Paenibacillus sp. JNUCC31]|uniref:ABC transporter substrate-binding protein n=1 Tax=Paenibacillus sp. JNUCC-31 TaxID=2777983 RepID=UPI001781A986|nr:extracellular solute-binding protein [Paenibacillus sp. JNUCC-31]QOS79422.1 extracellular solute-binding protein [Paenibacillus sp. JNUCC-31]
MHKQKKWARNFFLTAIVLTTLMALTACNSKNNDGSGTNENLSTTSETGKKPVTLRFLSNLPDRKTGQGLAEQTVIDNFEKDNPDIEIDLEALATDPFGNKLKIYMASNEPIDVSMVQSGATLNTLVQAGYIRELDQQDYDNDTYSFFPGVLKNFIFDGKLYGLPRNSDYEVIYYNKKLFADYGVKVPTTFAELRDTANAFRAKGIIPMSTNGKELWTFAEMYQNIAQRYSGDQNLILEAIDKKIKLEDDDSFLKAAQFMAELRDNKMFQDGYMAADYGASKNLFTQERAAMWYMGSWESGMASDNQLSQEFRDNLGVLKFPTVEGGKGKDSDLLSWNGGGYAIISKSKHPEEAKKFFDYMMRADQWAKAAWETGGAVPAQKYELTGEETDVQKQLTDVLVNATSTAGASAIDYGTAKFKDEYTKQFGMFFSSSMKPEELVVELQKTIDNQ